VFVPSLLFISAPHFIHFCPPLSYFCFPFYLLILPVYVHLCYPFHSLATLTHLAGLTVSATDRVLMGFFGMGSEPDYNVATFHGIPFDEFDGRITANPFPLLPGVTALKIFDSKRIHLDSQLPGDPNPAFTIINVYSGVLGCLSTQVWGP